jgi:hypothetical protein
MAGIHAGKTSSASQRSDRHFRRRTRSNAIIAAGAPSPENSRRTSFNSKHVRKDFRACIRTVSVNSAPDNFCPIPGSGVSIGFPHGKPTLIPRNVPTFST